MGIFLRPHAAGFPQQGVPQAGFLDDGAAILDDVHLSSRFCFDGLHHGTHGVDVLDLAAGAKRIAGFAHRQVYVHPQAALLHIAIAGAQITQKGAQFADIGAGLIRGA